MKNYFSESIMTIVILSAIICGTGYFFGSKAIDKIPNDNFRARLLKASEYISIIIFVFFIALMKFQALHYIGAPNESLPNTVRDLQIVKSIQNLQIAHMSFYYTSLFMIMTSFFLIKKALK